jgi:DNA-binding GntR family transcriptional regulator
MAKQNNDEISFLKGSESLGDDAYEWIVAAITSFRIPTNSSISENKLASELGISRTPVREALKRLESEGLVKRGDAGRFTVAMLTAIDVDEAIDFLLLCDVYLFKKAAEKLSASEGKDLMAAVKTMTAASKKSDRDSWIAADLIFHETIMRSANNSLVADAARITRRRVQRFWARSLSGAKDLATCSNEHTIIAEAIVAKDMRSIENAVKGHLSHLRLNMQEIVDSMAPFLGAQPRK